MDFDTRFYEDIVRINAPSFQRLLEFTEADGYDSFSIAVEACAAAEDRLDALFNSCEYLPGQHTLKYLTSRLPITVGRYITKDVVDHQGQYHPNQRVLTIGFHLLHPINFSLYEEPRLQTQILLLPVKIVYPSTQIDTLMEVRPLHARNFSTRVTPSIPGWYEEMQANYYTDPT